MAFDDDVDTVTPLDGDGSNATGVDEQFNNTPETEYETRGRTRVATRKGYRFKPSNKDLPEIHSGGVNMTSDEADAVVEESGGVVFIVQDQEG